MNTLIYFLNVNSSAVQAISTIVLVLVTIYYAYQAKRTVQVMFKQREDNMLPVVIVESFFVNSPSKKQDNYCIDVKLRNIGNGPAFSILIEFYDSHTKEFVAGSEHLIDYLEKQSSKETHIHILKKDFANMRYVKEEHGQMICSLTALITFHNFYSEEQHVEQGFVLKQATMEIAPVMGTFRFIPIADEGFLSRLLQKVKNKFVT